MSKWFTVAENSYGQLKGSIHVYHYSEACSGVAAARCLTQRAARINGGAGLGELVRLGRPRRA